MGFGRGVDGQLTNVKYHDAFGWAVTKEKLVVTGT